ncbi:MAG: pilus assembly protein PilM [Planctomycetes bacterium]|nr:pilus assembly protein PilM [Planctomycetota bacterium]
MSKFIAIDLDAQGIFVVSGTARSGHAKVEQAVAWSGTEADGGPPALTSETAKRIGEQLRERLKAAGMSQAPAIVAVPRDRVVLKELRYPHVPLPEEPNVVRFQALKELSDAPEDVILDYVPLAGDTAAGERRSMAVAIRKDLYRAIQQMCEAANIRLVAVTPRPYALAAGLSRAFTTSTVPAPESKADAVAMLTIAPGGGEFTVTRSGEVVLTRSVAGPVLASEAMLLGEVRRNLTMYAGANPGQPVQGLYVAEADGRWATRLRASLGIPVHAHDPLAGEVPSVAEEIRGRFAGAAGLLAARAVGDPPINFAEPRQPKPEADPAKKQILIAVLAALIFVGGGALVGFFALTGKALPTDPKTGKQENQAAVEVKLSAKNPEPVNELLAKIEADSIDPAPKNPKDPKGPPKFYVGADKTTGGASPGEAGARDYVVFARVNNRPADKFTRAPAGFTQPSRKGYPPVKEVVKEKEKEKESAETKESPAPRTKDTSGE